MFLQSVYHWTNQNNYELKNTNNIIYDCLLAFKCLSLIELIVNLLPQTSHPKGLSPVWILICTFKLDLCENFFLQTSHSRGVSL